MYQLLFIEIDEDNNQAIVGLPSSVDDETVVDSKAIVPLKAVTWARRYIDADKRGDKIKAISDVLAVGDIVLVKPMNDLPDVKDKDYDF